MLQVLYISGILAVLLAGITITVVTVRHKKAAKVLPPSTDDMSNSLRDEKLRSQIILTNIEEGVMLLDNNGIIRLFNPAAGRVSGWDPVDTIGLDYYSVLKLVDNKGQEYNQFENPISEAYRQKTSIHDNRANAITQSGKQISIDVIATPLLADDGTVSAVLGVFRDVSEERREEQQRAEFISTASHEMRTPVAAIEGYLALAMNDKISKIDDKARGFLEKAHIGTQHLGRLFQDLLTSAKVEDGRLTNHPVVLEMSDFIEQAAESFKIIASKKSLALDFILGSAQEKQNAGRANGKVIRPLYYTLVDPDRISEVLTNLFDNAVKYTSRGKITLGVTGNDQVVQISIADTGNGIAAEDIPHLFQKFYRIDTSKTYTVSGTGLGLFICRKILDLYQGRIWVVSELGKGSTFYINLPRLSSEKAVEMQVSQQMSIQPVNPT